MTKKPTLLSSIKRYGKLKHHRQIRVILKNIGKKAVIMGDSPQTLFYEIQLLDAFYKPLKGNAVFEIQFNASRLSPKTVRYLTPYTLPFFVGLPGFCHKQFFINEETGVFTGRYHWKTKAHAEKYVTSYCFKIMEKLSEPKPINYRIKDRYPLT